MLPSPYSCGLGLLGLLTFEATSAFTFVGFSAARRLAITPRMMSSIGFRKFGRPPPCYPSHGALTSLPGGIYPH